MGGVFNPECLVGRGLRASPKVIQPFVGALSKRASLSEPRFTGFIDLQDYEFGSP